MKQKPTILVISHKKDFPQRDSFIKLNKEFNLHFYKIKQR